MSNLKCTIFSFLFYSLTLTLFKGIIQKYMKTEPQTFTNKNSVDEIYLTLRKKILNEEFLPGDKLSEILLSKTFNCSRTPIRESIKRLERDGLITVQPKSGSYVKEHTNKDNKNLMELRSYVEGLAVRLIIERNADVLELEMILDSMDSLLKKHPVDIVAFGELHYEFHHTIIKLSDNDLCVQTFERLNLRSAMLFYHSMTTKAAKITQQEHRKIVELLKQGDTKCEKFTIDHLWKKRNSFAL